MKVIKSGHGWRLGWDPDAPNYQGLVGTDDWAIELTEAELNDFCRLLVQLAQTMNEMASELMDEEKIACEAETDLLWMQVEGYPHAYNLQMILNTGRRCEGQWPETVVAQLLQAAQVLKTF
jgi:hypothetical protein